MIKMATYKHGLAALPLELVVPAELKAVLVSKDFVMVDYPSIALLDYYLIPGKHVFYNTAFVGQEAQIMKDAHAHNCEQVGGNFEGVNAPTLMAYLTAGFAAAKKARLLFIAMPTYALLINNLKSILPVCNGVGVQLQKHPDSTIYADAKAVIDAVKKAGTRTMIGLQVKCDTVVDTVNRLRLLEPLAFQYVDLWFHGFGSWDVCRQVLQALR
jgi:hypothetical protein